MNEQRKTPENQDNIELSDKVDAVLKDLVKGNPVGPYSIVMKVDPSRWNEADWTSLTKYTQVGGIIECIADLCTLHKLDQSSHVLSISATFPGDKKFEKMLDENK